MQFSVLQVVILMACCITLVSSDNTGTNAITALESRPNIAPAGAGGSVQRSLRRSNSTLSIEGDTDEERGVWDKLKGVAKKLSFGSKRLQKTSSAVKTSENAIVQQAEAVLTKPVADALKNVQKQKPGEIARAEALAKQKPELVKAVEKSPSFQRIVSNIARDPAGVRKNRVLASLSLSSGLSYLSSGGWVCLGGVSRQLLRTARRPISTEIGDLHS